MKTAYTFNLNTASMKWKGAILTALLALPAFVANAQVGIGTITPDASAQLDVTSNAKGVLVPRLTSVQRTGIATPADGLLVYDTDTKGFWYFKGGTGWTEVRNATLTLPYADTGSNAAPLFSITNQGSGPALEGIASGTGAAGRFVNTNIDNTEGNVLTAETSGLGNIPNTAKGNAAYFRVDNSSSVASAVRAEVNSIFGNTSAAAVFATASGTGGYAGYFQSPNPSGAGKTLVAVSSGSGNAFTATGNSGNSIETITNGSGTALSATVPATSAGRVALFNNNNDDNTNEVILAKTIGNGIAGSFVAEHPQGTSPALKGEVKSQFQNFGTAGVYGLSSGTGGVAGLFYSNNQAGGGPAVIAITEGSGDGIVASAGGTGDGIESSIDGSGNAVYGRVPNFGTGKAALFTNSNSGNSNPTVHITNVGTGAALAINHTGSAGNLAVFQNGSANVARISKAGVGFFNGGTQNSGADIAEAFDVVSNVSEYEPGDVLSIATSKDRTIEKSAGAYSSLVLGVYATKPGVLLTEENIDSDLAGKVPMGVVGVIPTKVCLEGGIIQRGDLLVTSSIPGVAMKADKAKVQAGQILGKALQNFDGEGVGKINVFVNVK